MGIMNKRTLTIQLALLAFYGWLASYYQSMRAASAKFHDLNLSEGDVAWGAPEFPWIFVTPILIWMVWDLGAFFLRRGD